jgi:hypothetical protein
MIGVRLIIQIKLLGTNTRPLRPLDYFQAPRCRNLKMLLPSSQHSIE